MSDTFGKANRATPAATLEQQILDPNHPKNDGEWWAADEITRLRAEVERLDEAMEMLLTDVRRTDLDMSGLKAENERLSAYAKRAAMDVLLCKDGNILLHEKNEKLRAALEPLACTCDRPNGAACSRSEVDCPFWNARAALEGKQ